MQPYTMKMSMNFSLSLILTKKLENKLKIISFQRSLNQIVSVSDWYISNSKNKKSQVTISIKYFSLVTRHMMGTSKNPDFGSDHRVPKSKKVNRIEQNYMNTGEDTQIGTKYHQWTLYSLIMEKKSVFISLSWPCIQVLVWSSNLELTSLWRHLKRYNVIKPNSASLAIFSIVGIFGIIIGFWTLRESSEHGYIKEICDMKNVTMCPICNDGCPFYLASDNCQKVKILQ